MNSNAKALYPLFKNMYETLHHINNHENVYVIYEKNNPNSIYTIEILNAKVILNPNDLYVDFNARKTSRKYVEREFEWYKSKSNNVNSLTDIKVWSEIDDDNNEVNSNYGLLVFGRGNFNQFDNVLAKLKEDKDTRQGIIIYTRPSIHYEWNSLNVHDFICANFQQFFIRNNKLITITSLRSQDAVYGAFNDIPWFHYVIQQMYLKLKDKYLDLELGEHIYMPNSFHIYSKHFDLLDKIIASEE